MDPEPRRVGALHECVQQSLDVTIFFAETSSNYTRM